MSASWLLVRAGARRVGLALGDVVEVLDSGPVYPVPAQEPAVRGVTAARDGIMPLVHLGALLDGTACPERRGETTILVRVDGRPLCLEVDDAEEVLSERGHPGPLIHAGQRRSDRRVRAGGSRGRRGRRGGGRRDGRRRAR